MRLPRRFSLYLVVSAVLVATAVAATGWLAGAFFERHVLRREEVKTVAVVQGQARQHLGPELFEEPAGEARQTGPFWEFMSGLPGVFRVKAFDRTGRIVWSNEPRLIGQRFPDNPNLQAALAGRVTTSLGEPRRAEHAFERDRRWIAEVYVPVSFVDGAPVTAVLETYEDMTAAILALHQTRRRIWAIAGAVGLGLWVALALVVGQASASEMRAHRGLAAQNRELALLRDFGRSVLAPLDPDVLARRVVDGAAAGLRLARAQLYREADGREPRLLAAWPPDAEPGAVPPEAAAALATGRPLVSDSLIAVPVDASGCPHLFVGERNPDHGDSGAAAMRPLEIMLQEAAVALTNAQLFTQVREAHERIAAILAGIVDRLVIVDGDLRVVWMNEAARVAQGASAVGKTCFEVMRVDPEICEGCPAMRTLRSGQVERGVRVQRAPDGRTTYFDLVTAPLRDAAGNVHQVLEVARDISELMEMEERLKQTNQALLDAQAQLVDKERLAAIGQVVVGLHHAILNPLAGILGAVQVLREGHLGLPERLAALAAAEAEVRKIEALVRRLPDLRHAGKVPYVGGTTMIDLERTSGPPGPAAAEGRDP